ncbi:hypothetical protein B0H34DRAFT_794942 [Crassisporium funariophilum]|nr:hypothetical protein B0H34DRAFT_794942 [Crassisporium funariophilum]
MSEQQPLLLTLNTQPTNDVESQGYKCTHRRWRTETSHFLEHPIFHKTVITLIAIDAACVLADLAYTFLSPGCGVEHSPEWLEALSHISLAITTLFLIEIPLTLWALGFQYMNPLGPVPHAGLHTFDAVIIATTFTLEVVLRGKERELAGLLIFLRLWRLVKLVGGVAVGAGELAEENAKLLLETQRELENTKADLCTAEAEIQILRQRLGQLDSTDL